MAYPLKQERTLVLSASEDSITVYECSHALDTFLSHDDIIELIALLEMNPGQHTCLDVKDDPIIEAIKEKLPIGFRMEQKPYQSLRIIKRARIVIVNP